MRVVAIIQARMGSNRLPGKILEKIEGRSVLEHVVERVQRSSLIQDLIVATTICREDLRVVGLCAQLDIPVYVGSEEDVLDRYYQAARLYKADHIVRITADCPLHDHMIIDDVITRHLDENNDYTSNVNPPSYPDGLDCEVMKMSALQKAWENAEMKSEREHVTLFIRNQDLFKRGNCISTIDRSGERWTLDTERDLKFIREVYHELYTNNTFFSAEDVYNLLESKPEIRKLNDGIQRNEGLARSIKEDYKVNSKFMKEDNQ